MKRNLILASTLILTFSLVGCGQKEETPSNTTSTTVQDQQKIVSMDDIKSAILTEDLLQAPFGEAFDAKEFHVLADVADKIEEGFVCQAMMNVKFRDIIVVKTNDIETMKSTFEDYLASDLLRSFRDGYGGEDNIEAISNAIVNNSGDYVYLIATPNSKDVESKLLEVLK